MNVKTKALIKIILGIALFMFAFYFMLTGGPNATGGGYYLAAIAAPGVLALIGFLEIITGTEFRNLSKRWDNMPSWKKFILSIIVIASAIVLLFLGIYIFA